MEKKLSKAQERTLEIIRERYTPERIQQGIDSWKETVINTEDPDLKDIYSKDLEMCENGWILFTSSNSRTLEILKENGYIDYVKEKRFFNSSPIDWVKLM